MAAGQTQQDNLASMLQDQMRISDPNQAAPASVVNKSIPEAAITSHVLPHGSCPQYTKRTPRCTPNANTKAMGSALMSAAEHGRDAIVEQLLDVGVDPNTPDVLQRAAGNGHLKSVECLLDFGAEINATDSQGCTALRIAAERGHENTVKLLLDHGANPNLSDSFNNLPLMRSLRQEKIVKLLLDRGANPNTSGMIQRAAGDGHVRAVQLLLDAGADANAVDADNCTALQLAAERGNNDVVQLLLNHSLKPTTTPHHTPPQHLADSPSGRTSGPKDMAPGPQPPQAPQQQAPRAPSPHPIPSSPYELQSYGYPSAAGQKGPSYPSQDSKAPPQCPQNEQYQPSGYNSQQRGGYAPPTGGYPQQGMQGNPPGMLGPEQGTKGPQQQPPYGGQSQYSNYPPQQQAGYNPQQQAGYTPQQRAGYTSQQQAGYSPQQQAGYPLQQHASYPQQQQVGYPLQQQASYPQQQQVGYPQQQQASYPPQQQVGYPLQQQASYPPLQQSSYPPPAAGYLQQGASPVAPSTPAPQNNSGGFMKKLTSKIPGGGTGLGIGAGLLAGGIME